MTLWLGHGGADPESIHSEFLVLASVRAILAIVLFVQKAAPPVVSAVLLLVAGGLVFGAFALEP